MQKKERLFFALSIIVILLCIGVVVWGSCFASEEGNDKVAYITFDDGPTLNTPEIIKILNKYNAKATFFVLEERIVLYPDFIKQIVNNKHTIGLHGVSHGESIYRTPTSPLEEMEKTNKALYSLTGSRSYLVRVPYGSSYRLTEEQAKNLKQNGYILWDWNVDPRDSVGKIVPQKVLSNMRRDLARCKGDPVILLHDRKSTALLLDDILKILTEEGYRLEAISEKQTPIK